MSWSCSKCKSESIQKLSVVFESGLSSIATTSSGTGFGIGGGGLSLGAGSMATTGKSQTALSKKAAPPEKYRYRWPLIALFFSWMTQDSTALCAVNALIGVPWLAAVIHYNMKKWPPLYRLWQQKYLC